MIYSDPTVIIIDFGPEGHAAAPSIIFGQYRLLEDHWINDQLVLAGTTVLADGSVFPRNWIPTPNVEPLNAVGTTAFYNAGPRDLGLVRQQWTLTSVPQPITYWKQKSPNVWILTGLGSALAPVFGDPGHPIGGYPQ